MNFHDEMEKMQKQKLTIELHIDDGLDTVLRNSCTIIFTDTEHAIQEMQRQQKLEAALAKSSVAYLDGYNPYLN